MGRSVGFHFNADNCIGCHSCEAACSEKNDLPPHIAWRKVGMLEGGIFPNVQRMHISMACNHCENPVCLQGCPTLAYTKDAKTGAVIQDSETCFGCRYCTWVCPYNAPVYDPEQGSVSKCNMCVDRLADGLQPACVSACLGHALDFGDVDQMSEAHRQAVPAIPGFPDPAITRPNIRFQQERRLPREMYRVDDEPVQYHARITSDTDRTTPLGSLKIGSPVNEKQTPDFLPRLTNGHRDAKKFRWAELRSDEDSLVVFTLLTQLAVGGISLLVFQMGEALRETSEDALETLLGTPGQIVTGLLILLTALGLGLSTAHLGKPWRCYRALNNLRYSWVSREILFLGGFFAGICAFEGAMIFQVFNPDLLCVLGGAVAVMGWFGIGAMGMIYKIPARPYWNHPNTFLAFITSGTILGPLFVAMVLFLWQVSGFFAGERGFSMSGFMDVVAGVVLISLLLQVSGTWWHMKSLFRRPDEGAVSRAVLLQDYREYLFRRLMLSGVLAFLMILLLGLPSGAIAGKGLVISLGLLAAMGSEVIGRALFYKVVTPMTMPGAFFLKNKQFEQYARETGLAEDRCVGVLAERH